jgi:hypothetical protein
MKIYTLVRWDAEDLHRMGNRGVDIEREIKLEAPRLYATLDLAKNAGRIEATSYADPFPGTNVWEGSATPDNHNIDDSSMHVTVHHFRVMRDVGNDEFGVGKSSTCIAEFRIYEMEVYQ